MKRLTQLAVFLQSTMLFAAQPGLWHTEGAAGFLEADLQQLSVDSGGHLRLARAARTLIDTEAPSGWALASGGDGALYLATGHEGKVFRFREGQSGVAFDSPEPEVHALAMGPDGRLYAGTSPDGKVYSVGPDGDAKVYFDPSEAYIWALAFDREGRLFVATGGEGRVYRVERDGTSKTILSTSEEHILAMALDDHGVLFAGSTPNGLIYRVDRSLKVSVVLDSAFGEVKALGLGRDGSLYAALVDSRVASTLPAPPPPTPTPAQSAAPTAEITVTEGPAIAPALAPPGDAAGSSGLLVRIPQGGVADVLWASAKEIPYALLVAPDGAYVATGSGARIYRVQDDRAWTLLTEWPAGQATALCRWRGAYAVATSNPARVFALEEGMVDRGSLTSPTRDTGAISDWGSLAWTAEVPSGTGAEFSVRGGNTPTPDESWSAWLGPFSRANGKSIGAPASRYAQWRVVLRGQGDRSPLVTSVTVAYLQRNLPPRVSSITVHPPGEVFQKQPPNSPDPEVLGLDATPEVQTTAIGNPAPAASAAAFGRKMTRRGIQTFSWAAEDGNGDPLTYDLSFRRLGDAHYRLLRTGLSDPVFAWDTSAVPNGRYTIRVGASDSLGNPPAVALSSFADSASFEIDNAPPQVALARLGGAGLGLTARAHDDGSGIRRAEYSCDGGSWIAVFPKDGIADSPDELFEFTPRLPASPGPHVVVLRVHDSLDNVATAHIELP